MKTIFVPVDEYDVIPLDNLDGKGTRYDRSTVINLDERMSVVQVGLTDATHLFAECIVVNNMIEWMKPLGEIVEFDHNESFGLRFHDTKTIDASLNLLGAKWRSLVEAMGYVFEVLRQRE